MKVIVTSVNRNTRNLLQLKQLQYKHHHQQQHPPLNDILTQQTEADLIGRMTSVERTIYVPRAVAVVHYFEKDKASFGWKGLMTMHRARVGSYLWQHS